MTDKFLITCEGEIDKLIVKKVRDYLVSLGSNRRAKDIRIDKSKGNSEVLKKILSFPGNCIGIIDDDKRKPETFGQFQKCDVVKDTKYFNNCGLSLNFYPDQDKMKYLIVVNPAPENWLDRCAENANKSRTEYGLPEDVKKYRNMAKSTNIDEALFGKFIKSMLKASVPGKTLKMLIQSTLEFHEYRA